MKGISLKNGSIGYVDIPKCASTSIKHALYEAEYSTPFFSDKRLDRKRARKFKYVHEYFMEKYASIDSARIRILVVRDPVERFLSAYSNRVLRHSELSESHLDTVIDKEATQPPIYNPGIGQFIDNFEVYKEVSSIEWHTRPISEIIEHNISYFTHIYKTSELHHLEKLLSDNYHSKVRFRRFQAGGGKVHLKHLSREQLNFIIEYYREDYAMLEPFYSIDDIWEKWKSSVPVKGQMYYSDDYEDMVQKLFQGNIQPKKIRNKKILFVIHRDWYMRLHWLPRIKACLEQGAHVHLISGYGDRDNLKMLQSMGIACHEVDFPRFTLNPVSELKTYARLFKTIFTIKPDLIHSVTVKCNIYSGIIARILSIPSIKTVAGLGHIFSFKRNLFHKILRLFVLSLYRLSHSKNNSCIVFENTDDFTYFNRKKIVNYKSGCVIKGAGINTIEFYYSRNRPDSIGNILFASRLLHGKGLESLVHAALILHKQGIFPQIDVAGLRDSNHPDAIPDWLIAHWHQMGVINYLGHRTDIPNLIHHSQVVILPTTYAEGIPRILLEGAATGRPLIATDTPGCREIIKHNVNGLLVPTNNPEKLADAIKELIQSPGRARKMGKKGRLMIELEFSDKVICDQTLSLQEKMLGTTDDYFPVSFSRS